MASDGMNEELIARLDKMLAQLPPGSHGTDLFRACRTALSAVGEPEKERRDWQIGA